jgi:hypothetical protein
MSYDRVNPKNVLLLKANGFVSISMSNKKYYVYHAFTKSILDKGGFFLIEKLVNR